MNEIYTSDVIYMGGQVVKIADFKNAFPEWYEDWNVINKENTDEFVMITDSEYGVSATLNTFYKVDFNKAKADFVLEFEGGHYGGMYHPPVRLGEFLVFAPCRADRWAYFDIRKKDLSYIDIPEKYSINEGQVFVRSWKPLKDSLVYIPGDAGVFAKLDFKSGKITYYDKLSEHIKNEKILNHISAISVYGSSLLISFENKDELYEIDVTNMEITKIYKAGHGIRGIRSFFVIPRTDWTFFIEEPDKDSTVDERIIYKWNITTDEFIKIDKLPISSCQKGATDLLAGFLYYKGFLYVIPKQGDCFIKINTENNLVERVEINIGHNYLDRKASYYHRWCDGIAFPVFTYNGYTNSFAITLPYDFSVAEVDFEKRQIVNRRKWNVNGVERIIRDNLADRFDGGYYENSFYSLKDFMEDLQ